MDHIKHQRIKSVSKSRFLRKAIQFLLSVSFFSVLLSYSSLLLVYRHSLNFFSTFSMILHSYGIDRHCIFLLCNGILVFIVKNAGLINDSPPRGIDSYVCIKNRESLVPATGFSKMKELDEQEKVVMDVEEDEWRENRLVNTEEEEEQEGRGKGALITEDEVAMEVEEEEERARSHENWFLVTQQLQEDDNEEEEEETGLLSADELNKKCEDFIKKMREGIKIEAQQLVMF